MITIKSISNNIRFSTAFYPGAKGTFSLMKEDYIILPFNTTSPVDFQVGDYVDLRGVLDASMGGKLSKIYQIVDMSYPTYKNGGYSYELRLDAYYWQWKTKIFKYTPEVGGQEASWSLTASLDAQLGVFLRNLKALGYKYEGQDYTFSIDGTVENSAKLMSYDNINLLDAIFEMAKQWNCDCWVTDHVINFGRCEQSDPVKVELDVEAQDMSRSESKGTFATRIYAFGSTRNIPSNYRPVDTSMVVGGIVERRLMLPAHTPYVDAYEGMSDQEAIEALVVFDDIYPHRVGTISDITSYESEVDNEDGSKTKATFYRFKDSGIHFSKEYILEGNELKIRFQSGKLNGMEFGVMFNPLGLTEKNDDGTWNPDAQLWEIVLNEDYGRPLPDEILCPEAENTYVLTGWNSEKITELGLVASAEQELLTEAKKYIAKTCIDDGTYTATLKSTWVYEDQINRSFDMGQRINLVNPAYFKNGRTSRVIGFEIKLDKPYDSPQYTIGESAAYSRISDIEGKVESLTFKGQTYIGSGGSNIYIIKTNDSTAASNFNVFSALRTLAMFLRKDVENEAKELITFLKGILIGKNGSGFTSLQDGTSQLVVDRLYVKMKAVFDELEVKKKTHVGGEQVISPAGMKCIKVEELAAVYRCYFKVEEDGIKIENQFTVGQLAMSQECNIKTGISQHAGNRFYWRAVMTVGTDYIDLSKTECYTDSDIPCSGDDIIGFGHKTDITRQGAIVMSSTNEVSPSIIMYQGINGFTYAGKEVISLDFDKATGKARMKVYGDAYIGAKDRSSYIEYIEGIGVRIKMSNGKVVEQELDVNAAAASAAQTAANNASNTAVAAQTTASNAATSAATANSLLTDISNDNKLTATEKQSTKKEWDIIVSEKPLNNAASVKFGITTTTYDTAYNTLNTYITPLLVSLTTTSNITGTEFRAKFKAYYDARTNLLNTISEKAKKLADEAQASVDGIRIGVRNMLKKSNVELARNTYSLGLYDYAVLPVNTKTYAVTVCYTLGENNTYIGGYWHSGSHQAITLNKKGNKVVESFIVTHNNSGTESYMGFYQFPNGTFGSKVHWAVLVEGNKAVTDYIQAYEDVEAKITEVETNFEIREDRISAKVTEVTTKATQAATSAANAKTSETNASGSASTAGTKATAAANSATAAAGSATAAKKSADDAAVVLKDVTVKESSITQTAGQIATKVTEVNTKVTEANTAATNAKKSETAAGGSATAASGSAANAKSSADSAAAKLTTITEKESSINQTASQISTKVTEVTKKATEASTSATNAASSATSASGSASTATTKANAASSSATAAAGSATTAGTKAGEAATSATNAKNSADSAAAKLTTITQKESSINQTASNITLQVTEVTTKASQASASAANASAAAELAMAMSQGKMLYRDPSFEKGSNGIAAYNNLSNGVVTVTRVSGVAGNPNGSEYCLKIVTTAAASPGWGGWFLAPNVKANQRLVYRFIANIPTGRSLNYARNGAGNGVVEKWLTSTAGTGKWEEYAYVLRCGASGTFSSCGHFSLSGGVTPTASAPLVWYLAYATVYDVTDAEIDYIADAAGKYTTKTEHSSSITQLSDKIELKVAKTDFNALGTRVSNAETTITQHTGQIALKAAQSDVTALGTRMSNAEAKITPDAIKLTVSSDITAAKNAAINSAATDATTKANNAKNAAVSAITGDSSYYAGRFVATDTVGLFLFTTKIPEKKSNMIRMDFSGYMYGGQSSFELSLVFYTYSSGLSNSGYIVTGCDNISTIRIGVKGGNIVVEIKLTADVYYPGFLINVMATTGSFPISYAQGWSMTFGKVASGALFDSGVTNILVVPRKDSAAEAYTKAQFTVLSNEISSKVSTTTFNSLNSRVNNAETTITQHTNQIALKAAQTTVDSLGSRVSSAETTIKLHTSQIALKAAQTTVDALGTRMNSAEAKITPDAIKLTVKSQTETIADAAAKRTEVWVDATGLDASKYYPVTITLSTNVPIYTITFERTLNASYGKPSWSTHANGFSLMCRWTSNASGWGTIGVQRTILDYTHSHVTVVPVGNIGQMTNSSIEYAYVRGGSKYHIIVEGATGVSIALRNANYTFNSQTINILTAVTAPVPDLSLRPTTDTIKAQFTIDTGGISILGKKIALTGMVTFTSLDSSAQATINGKATPAQVATAKSEAISSAATDAQNRVNTLKGTLKSLAYLDTVEVAKLGSTIIDGGYLKTTLIKARSIAADKIAASAITSYEIAGNTITAAEIASGTITADQIASKTITAAEIATGAITADELAASSVTAGKIASRSITADRIVSGAITATEIASNAITAGKIASRSITADRIAVGVITSTEINATSIRAAVLTANSVTTTHLSAKCVNADKIDVTSIKAAILTAEAIAALNITTKNLSVTNGAKIGNFTIQEGGLLANTLAIIGMDYDGSILTIMPYGISANIKGNGGLDITALSGYATFKTQRFECSATDFKISASVYYNAPGVLWSSRIDRFGSILNSWGNGAGTVSCSRQGRGIYRIYHGLNHSQYFAFITATPYSEDGSNLNFGMIKDKGVGYFDVHTVDASRNWRDMTFEVCIVGKNN